MGSTRSGARIHTAALAFLAVQVSKPVETLSVVVRGNRGYTSKEAVSGWSNHD